MSVIIARTNELCSVCIYLPAEDIPGDERLTAIEMNDLCSNCVKNAKRIFVRGCSSQTENELCGRVSAKSPWIKRYCDEISQVPTTVRIDSHEPQAKI